MTKKGRPKYEEEEKQRDGDDRENEVREKEPQQQDDEYDEEDVHILEDAPKYYQPGIIPQAPLKPS